MENDVLEGETIDERSSEHPGIAPLAVPTTPQAILALAGINADTLTTASITLHKPPLFPHFTDKLNGNRQI